jgi:hypothetical protein
MLYRTSGVVLDSLLEDWVERYGGYRDKGTNTG